MSHPLPTRTLTINFILPRGARYGMFNPTLIIDQYAHSVTWGKQTFTIPADRPVHISCYIQHTKRYAEVSTVLNPHEPAELEYTGPAQIVFTAKGSIGAPGTTKVHGSSCLLPLLLLAIFFVAIVIVLVILL